MQAKMEPGNINILQLSPTLQATRSNYKLAHKGKAPLYLEYFLDKKKSKIIVDQLQSEQGGRFLRKRNRNMIVEVFEDIEIHEDFKWMTLGQIKKMMHFDNLINMDARSVISCIPLINANDIELAKSTEFHSFFDQNMVASLIKSDDDLYTLEEQLSWINEQKTSYELDIQILSLKTVKNWERTRESIKHTDKPFFEVIGVDVKAGNREVTSWSQPLIADRNLGLIAFIIKMVKGKYYFLVQAKVEPGNIDVVDMAPTISISNYKSYLQSNKKPTFYELVLNTEQDNILYDQIHSEEGGRFYHLQNRYMIVINNDLNENELPSNFRLMTLENILKLLQFGFFNIESRGLISCLDFFKRN
jgi:oxidase EvaA